MNSIKPRLPTVQVDEMGRITLARHADWWQRKGMLYVEVEGVPLNDL